MYLWIDGKKGPNSDRWVWLKNVETAKKFITCALDPVNGYPEIEIISLSYEEGNFDKLIEWIGNNDLCRGVMFHFHVESQAESEHMSELLAHYPGYMELHL